MGVNQVNQAATQEMSVALSQGAAQQLLQDITQKDKDNRLQRTEKSSIKQLLNEKPGNISKRILTDLASKVASMGVKLTPEIKLQQNLKDEYELLFKGNEDISDRVDLQTFDAVKAAQKLKNQNKRKGNQNQAFDAGEIKADVEEYSSAYARFMLSGGAELKEKLERLEAKFRKNGVSVKNLKSFQHRIKNSIRGSIAGQLKEAMLKRMLSQPKSMDWMLATKEIYRAFGSAQFNDRLGGWDFGGYSKHLQGAMDEKTAEAKGELREFVKEELERSFIAKHVGQEKTDAEIKELVKLGQKFGVNFKQFFAQWQMKKIDLGFNFVPYQGPVLDAATSQGQGQGREGSTGYEFTRDDEKEILINQLRALYMQRAVRGDWGAHLKTAFKIKKLKNGLIKLGINFGDFGRIEKEGLALARLRTMDMLREALYERATLYELAGPAKRLIDKRIKGINKNLERLGIVLSAGEFNQLRDEANRQMFDTALEELGRVRMTGAANPMPRLEKKERLLVKLLERLKEESGILRDIPNIPNLREAA